MKMHDNPFGTSPFDREPPAGAKKLKAPVHKKSLPGVLKLDLHALRRLHRSKRKPEMAGANRQVQLASRRQVA
jgi:hypothetical protein